MSNYVFVLKILWCLFKVRTVDVNVFVFFIVLTVGIYHLGVFIEFLLDIHDGARVFPVHGMW